MQLTQTKVNRLKVASLRKTIFSLSSSIAKYAGNKRVKDQLNKKAYLPILPPIKAQDFQPARMTEKPELIKAASRAREIGNLAKSEHDLVKLDSYKNELKAMHKTLKVVAPKSEFGKYKQ